MKEICFALLRSSRTNFQEKSTHVGGIASRVTMRPLEKRRHERAKQCKCVRQGLLMQVQRTTMQLWLAVSKLGNWLQCMGLLRRGARCRDRLRRGAWCSLLRKGTWCRVGLCRGARCGWLKEELTNGTGLLRRARCRDRLRRGAWCGRLCKRA